MIKYGAGQDLKNKLENEKKVYTMKALKIYTKDDMYAVRIKSYQDGCDAMMEKMNNKNDTAYRLGFDRGFRMLWSYMKSNDMLRTSVASCDLTFNELAEWHEHNKKQEGN